MAVNPVVSAGPVDDPAGFERVLSLVLAQPGSLRRASRANISSYAAYLQTSQLPAQAFQGLDANRVLRGALLALRLPGKTTIFMLAPPDEMGTSLEGMIEATSAALAAEAALHPHYVQSLIELNATGKRQVLEATGFRLLTRLQYLEAPVSGLSPDDAGVQWRSAVQTDLREFEQAVARTYVDSEDCPELHALRSESDALASHRASGRFSPEYWELCVRGDEVLGCLLAAPLPSAQSLEVVYMGVMPEQRRRGVGRQILARAAWHARRSACQRVLLVVDARNLTAKRLYERCGFRCVSLRDAFLYVPNGPAAERIS